MPHEPPRAGRRISASSRPISTPAIVEWVERRRVATDRRAGRVDGGERLPGVVRARGAQVELVRVARGEPVASAASRRPPTSSRGRAPPIGRPRPAGDVDRLRVELRVVGSRPGGPRTTSRPARPTGRGGSPACPPSGRPARRSAGTAGRAAGARARSSRPRRRPRSGRRSSRRPWSRPWRSCPGGGTSPATRARRARSGRSRGRARP